MIKSKRARFGDWVIAFICLLLILICLLPLVNQLARSLSTAEALIRNEVMLWPKGLNLESYRFVLSDSKYTWSLLWTAILTVICTAVSMLMTILCAYPLTYEKLKGRRLINVMILFTMFFNAGLIPSYLLMKNLHMIDRPTVLIFPGALSVFYMIIMRTYFYGLPEGLRESAEIDGAGPVRILTSIYLPLSKPVIATLSLFYAVNRWNGWQDALFFMGNNDRYHPISLLLNNIIRNVTSIDVITQEGFVTPGLSQTIQAATVMFATVPILLVYPFLQRYFVSGATLGSIKD